MVDRPPYIFETRIAVRDYELDAEGIVNNANYLHYLELTRHEFCAREGVPFGEMARMGVVPVVRRIEIDYISSLRSGDVMVSRLAMRREGARFVFFQDIFTEDGRHVVSAKVSVVSLEDGRLSRGDKLAAGFTKYLS